MTPKRAVSSCADVRAASSRFVSGALAVLMLAALLAGITLGVARLLVVLVLPAEFQMQQFLAELARSQTAAPEP